MHKMRMNKVPSLYHSWRKSWIPAWSSVWRSWYLFRPDALACLVVPRILRKRGTLTIPGIVQSDCLTQKRESYLLRLWKTSTWMSSLAQSGGIRDWTMYNWCYTCNIINMNCFQKKFHSKDVSLYDKGHFMQHDMLIKLFEWRRRQVTSSNVKRRHWHNMSVSLHAGLIHLQLRHCGHLGIKLIRKVCSIRIWENVIFENFVTKVPFRLTLLI